jgi:hypothetical protein
MKAKDLPVVREVTCSAVGGWTANRARDGGCKQAHSRRACAYRIGARVSVRAGGHCSLSATPSPHPCGGGGGSPSSTISLNPHSVSGVELRTS